MSGAVVDLGRDGRGDLFAGHPLFGGTTSGTATGVRSALHSGLL